MDEPVMTVKVHMYTQSHPVLLENVRNAYQKGSLYCVMQFNGSVRKFPIEHIFCITEIGSREAKSLEKEKPDYSLLQTDDRGYPDKGFSGDKS